MVLRLGREFLRVYITVSVARNHRKKYSRREGSCKNELWIMSIVGQSRNTSALRGEMIPLRQRHSWPKVDWCHLPLCAGLKFCFWPWFSTYPLAFRSPTLGRAWWTSICLFFSLPAMPLLPGLFPLCPGGQRTNFWIPCCAKYWSR